MDVWLHVGTGKTGTSAIQVGLARARERLAAAGLHYPAAFYPDQDASAREGGVTSGNALALGRLLQPRLAPSRFDPAAARAWLAGTLAEAGGRALLFSSEAMQMPDAEAAAPVLALLGDGGRRRVRVLYYVRHALDHTVAGYAQALKIGEGRAQPLEEYLAGVRIPFAAQLEAWARLVGREAIACRLYDEDRADLLRSLLATVHPAAAPLAAAAGPPEGVADRSSGGVVNRSPTPAEMRLLVRLNAEPDAAALCRRLVQGVLNAPPAVPQALSVGEAAYAAFAANNAATVEAINRDWLGPAGRASLRLTAGSIRIGEAAPAGEAAAAEATVAAAFIGTVRQMEAELGRLRRELRRAARGAMPAEDAPGEGGPARPAPRTAPATAPTTAPATAPAAGAAVQGAAAREAMAAARRAVAEGRIEAAIALLDAAERDGHGEARLLALRERLRQRHARRWNSDAGRPT